MEHLHVLLFIWAYIGWICNILLYLLMYHTTNSFMNVYMTVSLFLKFKKYVVKNLIEG
jgi:hypothetical protein